MKLSQVVVLSVPVLEKNAGLLFSGGVPPALLVGENSSSQLSHVVGPSVPFVDKVIGKVMFVGFLESRS